MSLVRRVGEDRSSVAVLVSEPLRTFVENSSVICHLRPLTPKVRNLVFGEKVDEGKSLRLLPVDLAIRSGNLESPCLAIPQDVGLGKKEDVRSRLYCWVLFPRICITCMRCVFIFYAFMFRFTTKIVK